MNQIFKKEMMGVAINQPRILSLCMHGSNHHAGPLQHLGILFVIYTSEKLETGGQRSLGELASGKHKETTSCQCCFAFTPARRQCPRCLQGRAR